MDKFTSPTKNGGETLPEINPQGARGVPMDSSRGNE